jgi:hypothetical protein
VVFVLTITFFCISIVSPCTSCSLMVLWVSTEISFKWGWEICVFICQCLLVWSSTGLYPDQPLLSLFLAFVLSVLGPTLPTLSTQ